jgi:hypothetical protein
MWPVAPDSRCSVSEFKGTPGPWHYQERSDAYTHIVRNAEGNEIIVYAPQSTLPKAEANARLASAAWDLLHALKLMVDDNFPDLPLGEQVLRLMVAEQAIAKATGAA